jgi:hypothetical protein
MCINVNEDFKNHVNLRDFCMYLLYLCFIDKRTCVITYFVF